MMKHLPWVFFLFALPFTQSGCGGQAGDSSVAQAADQQRPRVAGENNQLKSQAKTPAPGMAGFAPGRVIHVLVALCDNEHQGIVPVPAKLGNGEELAGNLYWGAGFGVRTFFTKSAEWRLVRRGAAPDPAVLERCVFRHRNKDAWLVADAYRGREIRQTISDFFAYVAGAKDRMLEFEMDSRPVRLAAGGRADLITYLGHDGLMDFRLDNYPKKLDDKSRDAIMLCCLSRRYFSEPLKPTGANPLLWTNGLMAPEAYILKTAIDGWLAGEGGERIRERAATSYNTYQKCGLRAARNLFSTGW
ncbi:MAG TPA: hypothetical protein VFD58_14050 [Blastocatellia bacterium]|nr:hypothetical protein [Blastocatellia bacterium]